MGNDDITIVSSTDSPEQVQAALTGTPVSNPDPAAPATPAAPAEPAAPAPGEPAPAAEAIPANETPEQKTERERRTGSVQKRLDKIKAQIDEETTRKYEARRAADAEEARLRELRREREQLEAAKPPAAPAPVKVPEPSAEALAALGPKPKLADTNPDGTPKFKDYEEWVDGVSAWHAKQSAILVGETADRLRQEQSTAAERERIEHAQATRANDAQVKYTSQVEAFKARTPDFDAVMAEAKESVLELLDEVGPHALDVIDQFTVHDADNGPAVEHYLASHPDEMRRLATMPVAQQLIALAKLDSRFQAASPASPAQPKTPPVSKAPAPIAPVGGTPTASTVSAEDEDYAAYKLRRETELKARGASVR